MTERDSWGEQPPPNPVFQIMGIRTAQVGGAAGLTLAALSLLVPKERLPALALATGGLVSAGLSAYFIATFTSSIALPGCPQIARLPDSAGNAIALTFDDGPHPETTPRLLDILATMKTKATFFLVGERATRYPELTRRIATEGHCIGIHGLRHRTMVIQDSNSIERDLKEAVAGIEAAIGSSLPRPLLLRPPYGFKTWTLCQTAYDLDFRLVTWSLDSRDYDEPTPQALIARIASRLVRGDIVLLHERPDSSATVEALPRLLELCQKRGLAPIALSIS